ncbi:M23 family metallopeptidase [Leucobacter sp. wl10]|uniref:M23 family metallopeptidase n=1 Tax=Leucobacter sp. wl10 TaxID=2304677 RepID=UPI000E5B758E|nr:M23 family metallopeptidase [Leucobacter sp. wl10]RGE19085.1 M23 family peptidase [Leucobacter sp. wl10]
MSARGVGVGAVIAIPVLIVGGLLAMILLLFGPSAQAACGPAAVVNVDQVPEGPIAGYSGEQLRNAAHIMNAASALGLQRDAQVLGVMTAMGESSLRVLDYGDEAGPDSRGLFQQRDSWGTLEERMDPTISATKFFTVLMAVADWQTLEPTIAAHRVQRNADPYHYEAFYAPAGEIVAVLAGGDMAGCQSGPLVFPLATEPMYQFTSGYGFRGYVMDGISDWHNAVDMQHWPNPCDDPIYAITNGTVTYAEGYQIGIKHPDGYTIWYVHMYPEDMFVSVGDVVTPGQEIALVGTNGPSTGCHLHLGVEVVGTTNEAVAALPRSETIGGPIGYVNPEEFYRLFGLELCPADTCRRTY